MRLQVFLSRSGLCSRRKAFDLVKLGQVFVNNCRICEPAYSVDPLKDNISVDGKFIEFSEKQYILFNKPTGVVTTRKDRFASRTIFDCLPEDFKRLFPVGRLDKESSGLLILTNDGDLAFRLMHPRFLVEKQYIVSIDRGLNDKDKLCLEGGVILDGKRTGQAKISFLSSKQDIKVIIHEGAKRHIRRMFSQFGYKVLTLKRVAYGALRLGDLNQGNWRKLSQAELDLLFKNTGLVRT